VQSHSIKNLAMNLSSAQNGFQTQLVQFCYPSTRVHVSIQTQQIQHAITAFSKYSYPAKSKV